MVRALGRVLVRVKVTVEGWEKRECSLEREGRGGGERGRGVQWWRSAWRLCGGRGREGTGSAIVLVDVYGNEQGRPALPAARGALPSFPASPSRFSFQNPTRSLIYIQI